jgi:transketolase
MLKPPSLDQSCVNTFRFVSVDMVEKADSGHPGLPMAVTARLAVEAASPLGWERWTVLEGAVIGIDRFGASAPGATVFKEFGFTADHVVAEALALAHRHSPAVRRRT